MDYYKEEVQKHLLDGIRPSDQRQFVKAYDKAVDSLNVFEEKHKNRFPSLDIAEVVTFASHDQKFGFRIKFDDTIGDKERPILEREIETIIRTCIDRNTFGYL
ncbi:MAG TPA: hypothetical protein VG052_03700 [Puia sp.]|jgi:hypothetical protein|nr:hypothetical protein [Puia sp.]